MRVSHQDDHLSSIGVGAKKTTAFSIAQTPEFFMVLSKSLYSNERLAVVREVLCNGWDAHIASECTEIALEVTLTDEAICFRDFGPGISKDQIGQNYCTYGGGSTKTNDGRQTGGFSLGSKAPFAYADSFEVVSCHKGTKTIYNMVKSSPDNDGLPAADEILSIPTSDTGLTVTINLNSPKDRDTFERYVRTVARNGEMNVKLNGKVLETIPFSKCKRDFLFTPVIDGISQGLWVRYGNVLYPVPEDDHFCAEYGQLSSIIGKTTNTQHNSWGNNALVLLAPPNSISVTPSRESLSMSDTTKNTIQLLLKNLLQKLTAAIDHVTDTTISSLLDTCFHPGNLHQLTDGTVRWLLPIRKGKSDYELKAASKVETLAKNFVYFQAKNSNTKSHRHIKNTVLRMLANSNLSCSPLIKDYIRAGNQFGQHDDAWFGENVIRRLQKKLVLHPTMDHTRLNLCRRGPYGEYRITRASNKDCFNYENTINLIRGHVIITHTKVRVLDHGNIFPAMKHHFGRVEDSLVYIVPRRPGEVEKAKEFFTKMGFYPVDATALLPNEKPVVKERAAPTFRPKRTGFVQLSALRLENGQIDYSKLNSDNLSTIEKPSAVIRITPSLKGGVDGIQKFSGSIGGFISRVFGEQIAVVETTAHLEKAKQAGAVDLIDFLEGEIIKQLSKSSQLYRLYQIQASLAAKDRRYMSNKDRLISGIASRADLSAMLGLHTELNPIETSLNRLIVEVAHSKSNTAVAYVESLVPLPPHKKTKELVNTVAQSTRVNVIDWADFDFTARDEYTQKAQQDIIKFALKG